MTPIEILMYTNIIILTFVFMANLSHGHRLFESTIITISAVMGFTFLYIFGYGAYILYKAIF